jgi:uncharacterized protein YbjT (DUF2867 family)
MERLQRLGLDAAMTTADHTTLVIGGTGKTGRRVASRLTALGCTNVRVGSRAGAPAFDWESPTTWPAACVGVDALYVTYQPDLTFPGAVERVADLAATAHEAGARRLVLLSGRNEERALAAERAVRSSGLDWTIVRSSFFNQNFSESFMVEPIVSGTLAFPGGDVAEPFIDADDIADVAVAAFTSDRHVGEVYEVTGPQLLRFGDVVDIISAATGRRITYFPITYEQLAEGLRQDGLPAEEVDAYVDLFATVLDGRNSHLTDGVERALGRPARDFRAFAAAVAPTGVWDAAPRHAVA